MKRFKIKDLIKDTQVIVYNDWYTLNAGYRVENINDPYNPIGYITFNQMCKLNLVKVSSYYGRTVYVIKGIKK